MNDKALLPTRLAATPAALELIAELQRRHGPVVFHQSAGCCEGSAPICLLQHEFVAGPNDQHLGTLGGAAYYTSAAALAYLTHGQRWLLDVIPGDSGSFSLDNGSGRSFVLRTQRQIGAAD